MENVQTTPIRTYTVLEILDRTFRLYRENFVQYAGLVAIVTIPLTVFNLIATQSYLGGLQSNDLSFRQQQAAASSYLTGVFILAMIVGLLQAVFVNGTLTYIASENHLGQKVTIAEAFSRVRGRFMTLFLALFVFYLVIGGLAFISAITVTCLIGILGFGLLIYMGVTINAFLAPTIVLENVGVTQAINRSLGLGKARFWTVLGLMALIFVISFILQFAFTLLQQLLGQGVVASASLDGSTIVSTIIQTIITIFIAPITPIAFTLMYYDTRIRLEALDIALAATGKPDARPSDLVSPPADAALKGKDYANILILVVGGFVILFVLGATVTSLINTFMPNMPVR
jgi:hypothetical protein